MRVRDAPVDMALRGEVDDGVKLFFGKEGVYAGGVGNIPPHEAKILLPERARERRQLARIGEIVEADDAVRGVRGAHIVYEISADEPGPAGDQNAHEVPPSELFFDFERERRPAARDRSPQTAAVLRRPRPCRPRPGRSPFRHHCSR